MNAMSWHMYTTRRQVVVATVVNRAGCSRCTFDETMSLIRIYELTLETGALVLCSVLLRAALGGHSSKGDFRGHSWLKCWPVHKFVKVGSRSDVHSALPYSESQAVPGQGDR